jgi:hypothetical protein
VIDRPVLARLALAVARSLSAETLGGLVDVVFVRTRKQLERAVAAPRAAQEARLRRILDENADTVIGRRYGFKDIADLDDYRKQVPLCSWDDVAPLVDRMIAGERGLLVSEAPFFYATTSGTTGRRKLIPVTSSFVDECRVANKLLYRATLAAMPALLKGKRLSMRSPGTEELAPGIQAGSITVALGGGFEDEEGLLDAVPVDVFFVDDFEARYFLALRFALQERVTVCSAVNPSTLLLFARVLADRADELALALENGLLGIELGSGVSEERRARLEDRCRTDEAAAARIRRSREAHGQARMRDVFPGLSGLVCWKGGSAPWYLEKMKASYGELPVLDYGYCASEGCFGAALGTDTAASVLLPHGHVIELIPEEAAEAVRAGAAPTVLLEEAEVGRRYLVVVTTGAGLYRYEMNDVVEITGKLGGAPLAVFRHKAGAMASVTGEKVGESHVVAAMAEAQRSASMHVVGFAAAPLLPEEDRSPRYVLAVDPGDEGFDDGALASLAGAFDRALREQNEEYDAKRQSLRLEPPVAVALPRDAVRALRARRVTSGAPDAHVKVPHVSADGALLLELGLESTAPSLAARLPCRVGARSS